MEYDIYELGEVQISLHKIMHVDWFRFCALRHDDEAREMSVEIADNCGSEEERQPGKRRRRNIFLETITKLH